LRVAAANLAVAGSLSTARPAIGAALEGSLEAVSRALDEEEREERRKDREYWEPLKRELEDLRRARR